MKLTTGILILGIACGTAAAQKSAIVNIPGPRLVPAQQAMAPSQAHPQPAAAKTGPQKVTPAKPSSATTIKPTGRPFTPRTMPKTTKVAVNQAKPSKLAVAVEDKKTPVESKKDAHPAITMAGGRRDPFLSPVVNRSMGGSGCSTGKRCLAVDQIALTGVVKADGGMIAVVMNAMNKAYFLRENDPVFNGYVVKITGDSIIFKETMQDKLGKSFTREVTKKISTPAV